MAAIAINDALFESEVLQAPIPVLVDFWAPWCGPCQAMSAVVDQIAQEYAGRLKVVTVNVDHAPQAATRFLVDSIPNFAVIDRGEVKARLVGVRTKQALVDAVAPYLHPEAAACPTGGSCARS